MTPLHALLLSLALLARVADAAPPVVTTDLDDARIDFGVAANFKTVKRMTIDEKVAHWRWVMRYAKHRNIDVYFITWNIWTHGATNRYGITDDQTNEKTTAYFRESVKQFVLTYPDLAGLGLTLGEHFDESKNDQVSPEDWGWQTYGRGIEDAMADPAFYAQDPDRELRFIHRVWYGGTEKIFEGFTRKYPGPVDLSFKYSRARLYSTPTPPFFDNELRAAAKDEGIATWMNLRNDDLFTLRWGDPEYVRAYIQNLPPEPELAGFHMGSDGYVWARTFGEKLADGSPAPRRLEIDKHWYRFMMWGRLAYDPELPRDFFESRLAERFADRATVKPAFIYDAWAIASKIVPLVNLAHWRDWDHQWSVETCMSKKDGYHSVDAFIEFGPRPKNGLLSVDSSIRDPHAVGRSPLDVADELDELSDATLNSWFRMRLRLDSNEVLVHSDGAFERNDTISDLVAFAHLGAYYADKLRGATALHRFRIHGDSADQQAAIQHLENADAHWRDYGDNLFNRQPVQLLARVSFTDWTRRLRQFVRADIDIARNAQHNVFPESVVGRTH